MSEQKLCPTCGTEYPISERFCPRDGTALRGANPTNDLVGTIVGNNFHIIKKLGEGGMGTVYLAEHVKMGRKAALKVMNPGMNQDPDAVARFNREATNASKLSHPNICGIYDFGETAEGLIFLAMEFIDGDALSAVIEKNGALPAPRAASIIHQSADALQVAHDYGIVHRDLKPDNIMIARARDGSDMVKVVDFGIAKASSSDAQKVTKTGLVVGTPEYMSPEQLAGDKLDGRSDIYSLGLVAFNCLTGKLPFPSNSAQEAMIMRLTDHPRTLAEMRPDIAWPEQLEAVMAKALARDAVDRYQSAAEFGRDMHRATENMPATIAAEQGTQVMGAGAAVAAAAARTAAAPAVPKTRVAGPADRGKTPAGAVPLVKAPKKSGMPMALVAGIAVVVIGGGGFAAWKSGILGGGGAAPTDSSSQVAGAPAARPQTGNPPGVPQGGNPPAGTTGGAINPEPVGGNRGTTKLSNPVNTGTSPERSGTAPAGGGGAPPAGGGGAPAVNFEDKITAWKEWSDPVKSSEPDANRAIADINATLPTLSGTSKVRAYLYLGSAYMIIGREQSACDAWMKGRAESGGKESSIENMITGVGCK